MRVGKQPRHTFVLVVCAAPPGVSGGGAQCACPSRTSVCANTSKFCVSFAVRFPFNPSNINLAELLIPEQYFGIQNLVRKV